MTAAEKAVGHPLSLLEAGVICDGLAALHIHVKCRLANGNVHLSPIKPVTTLEEVTALRAFSKITDQRMVWHPRLEVVK